MGQALDRLLVTAPETPATAARIPVRQEDGIAVVPVAAIQWVEADGDYARLHTGKSVVTVRETMATLEARLTPFRFVRVHRSAIVNAEAVRLVTPIAKGGYHLALVDGSRIRSGRRYREVVRALVR